MKHLLWLSLTLVFSLSTLTAQKHPPQPSLPSDTMPAQPAKILHAEPLYIDLIRDLGARRGEKEWNVGLGMTDRLRYDSYEFLVEYEWAPIDRLGLEVEVPVTLYAPNSNGRNGEPPSDRIESLKLAAQYTFLVAPRWKTSLAIGGITELELVDLDQIAFRQPLQGILYNPFLVAAKRWGDSWHSLIYTGPRFTTHFGSSDVDVAYEVNTSVHYMIPDSRDFVGLELNQAYRPDGYDLTMRPQMRLVIHEGLMVGIVSGIPLVRESERLSAFVRLIYEPGHGLLHRHH